MSATPERKRAKARAVTALSRLRDEERGRINAGIAGDVDNQNGRRDFKRARPAAEDRRPSSPPIKRRGPQGPTKNPTRCASTATC